MPQNVTIRESNAGDAPLLFRLFAENKAAELAPLGLPTAALSPLIDMQYRARSLGYAQQFPAAVQYIVVDEQGEDAGQVLLDDHADPVRVVDFAIESTRRNRGLGAALLAHLQARALARGKAIALSVNTKSPGRRLYDRLGFAVTAGDAATCEMLWSPAAVEVGQ